MSSARAAGVSRWRLLPWLFAAAGLVVPLVVSDFRLSVLVALWAIAVGVLWAFGRDLRLPAEARLVVAVALLLLLLQAGFLGGWWLVPANAAWLGVEIRTRPGRPDTTIAAEPDRAENRHLVEAPSLLARG